VLLFALLWAMPASAHASSARGFCANNLREIGLALERFRQVNGSFPTDIYDEKGKALLSWRVRLLPFVEEVPLFERFRLNEPWDSLHNLQFVRHVPHAYWCQAFPREVGLTHYLIPRGDATVLAPGAPPAWRPIRGDPSRTIMVIEVDDDHAVPWSKPDDLNYDPDRAGARAGLGKHHWADKYRRACLTVFADSHVGLIPEDINEDLLRSMFSVEEGGQIPSALPWYLALDKRPVGILLGVSLGFGLLAVVGSIPILMRICAPARSRLLRCRPTAPGEFLWLIVGAEQLVFVFLVMRMYHYEQLPKFSTREDWHFLFWFLPSVAGTLASVIPLVWYRSVLSWRLFFAGTLLLFALGSWDALIPEPGRTLEASLVNATSPVLLGIVGIAAACATLGSLEKHPAWEGRRLAHWLGILLCLIPFTWLVICVILGWVSPWSWFFRSPLVRE
jgi:hypothetical protein